MSNQLSRTKPARWAALLLPLTLSWLAPACLVDLDARCGVHQVYDTEQGNCACTPDYALVDGRCEPCGEHETGSPDGCVCAEGFARATPDADCAELAGLGQDCTSDADCGDPNYGYCHKEASQAGYCTAADCSPATECPSDFGCNDRQTPTFCERPPQGLGTACTSSKQCEGNAASYCETVSEHACVVNDCKPDPNKCHGDWLCCDIGLLSQSLCVPPSALEDGNCPAGGTLISRPE